MRVQRRPGRDRDAICEELCAQLPRHIRTSPRGLGFFTYDSAKILFAAINRAKSYRFAAVERGLRATQGHRGATGTITINRKTGYRKPFRSAFCASTTKRDS